MTGECDQQIELVTCYIYIIRGVTGTLTVTMAILARLGVNIAANIGFQYAAEMLPTVVRAQGVSLIHIIGYIAHIVGPYVIYLVKYHENPRDLICTRYGN